MRKAEPSGSKPGRARAKPGRPPAALGANRGAVLTVVRERPGVTAGELATASGVTGGTLYALVPRLTEQGEHQKREPRGGQTGYALASGAAATIRGAGTGAGGQDRTHAEDPAASEQQTGPLAASAPDADT